MRDQLALGGGNLSADGVEWRSVTVRKGGAPDMESTWAGKKVDYGDSLFFFFPSSSK